MEVEGSNEAMENLEEAAQSFHESSTGLVERCEHFIADPRCKERWRSVACFFSRSWFTHVWLIQEFQAAKAMMERMFHCGSKRLKASVLALFVRSLASDGTSLKSLQTMRVKCPKDLIIPFDRGAGCFGSMFTTSRRPLWGYCRLFYWWIYGRGALENLELGKAIWQLFIFTEYFRLMAVNIVS